MIKRAFPLLMAIAALLVSSCATGPTGSDLYAYQPLIDKQNTNEEKLNRDLSDCREMAWQFANNKDMAGPAAIAGATLGFVLGKAGGLDDKYATDVAGVGLVSGAVAGYGSGRRNMEIIVRNCLIGRGYRVLN